MCTFSREQGLGAKQGAREVWLEHSGHSSQKVKTKKGAGRGGELIVYFVPDNAKSSFKISDKKSLERV